MITWFKYLQLTFFTDKPKNKLEGKHDFEYRSIFDDIFSNDLFFIKRLSCSYESDIRFLSVEIKILELNTSKINLLL